MKKTEKVFNELTDWGFFKRLYKTALDKYPLRVLAFSFCSGFLFSAGLHTSLIVDLVALLAWLFIAYTTFQKVKNVILQEEELSDD